MVSVSCAVAQTGDSGIIHVKSTGDFEVTGSGTSPSWEKTGWIALQNTEGPLTYSTNVKLLYSENGIYVLFHCDDQKISATMQEDFADLWKEDVVEIFFWTDEAAPVYFEYELSPLDKELAILVPNFHGDFLGWRPWHYEGPRKVRHAVRVMKENEAITGWTGEFFIPFALLKPLQNVPAKKGMQWRVNMYRIDYDGDKPSEWAWRPVGTNFHEYTSFGKMVFE